MIPKGLLDFNDDKQAILVSLDYRSCNNAKEINLILNLV